MTQSSPWFRYPKMLSNEFRLDLSLRKIVTEFFVEDRLERIASEDDNRKTEETQARKGQWHWGGGKAMIHKVLRKFFDTISWLIIR